jgi:hypothetical protein
MIVSSDWLQLWLGDWSGMAGAVPNFVIALARAKGWLEMIDPVPAHAIRSGENGNEELRGNVRPPNAAQASF